MTSTSLSSDAALDSKLLKEKQILVQNLVRLSIMDGIRRALDEQGIAMLYLKGGAYLDTLYPDLGSRWMCDVDILVPEGSRSAVDQLLQGQGFSRIGPADRPATYDEHYEWVYTRSFPVPIVLEVHQWFCQPERYLIDYPGVWRRAVVHSQRERSIPTLCPEDSLLYTALHEAMHSFVIDERSSEDIRRIVEQWQPDWLTVVTRAKAWRMTLAHYVSLNASRMRSGTRVPEWVLQALEPHGVRRVALAALVDVRGTGRAFAKHFSRAHQLATMCLSMDDTERMATFGTYYAALRVRDALGAVKKRLAHHAGRSGARTPSDASSFGKRSAS